MYDSLDSLIDKLHLLFPANEEVWELDGLACGGLCGGLDNESLFLLMLKHSSSDPGEDDDPQVLREYIDDRYQSLEFFELSFEPIIADDDESLQTRTDSLAIWCHGFVVGLESSGIDDLDDESVEIIQILESVASGSTVSSSEEEGEKDFFELLEFVKVGAALLFLDLQNRLNHRESPDED